MNDRSSKWWNLSPWESHSLTCVKESFELYQEERWWYMSWTIRSYRGSSRLVARQWIQQLQYMKRPERDTFESVCRILPYLWAVIEGMGNTGYLGDCEITVWVLYVVLIRYHISSLSHLDSHGCNIKVAPKWRNNKKDCDRINLPLRACSLKLKSSNLLITSVFCVLAFVSPSW